jgi:hypothetical protein
MFAIIDDKDNEKDFLIAFVFVMVFLKSKLRRLAVMRVFIRKFLYVLFWYFLIKFAVSGYGLTYRIETEILLVGAAVILQPVKWDREWINWRKFFGLSEEDKKEK